MHRYSFTDGAITVAARKAISNASVGLFDLAPRDAGIVAPPVEATSGRRRLSSTTPKIVKPAADPIQPIPIPVIKSEIKPHAWPDPEGRIERHISEGRYCPPPPPHPMHKLTPADEFVVKLRSAVDTLAPDWLCRQMMKEAAFIIEQSVLSHCYECHENNVEHPCDPGNVERGEADRRSEKCPIYKKKYDA